MAGNDLFETEEAALRAATELHAQDSLDAAAYRDALGALIAHFQRLVRDTRRVIMHSDRQERELNALNTRLRQLADELDYKSRHDPLTGAFNRRAVIELAEAHLRNGALSLVVLDIDHFKHVNDECGHPAGDAVIVELVARLRAAAPEHAEVGRVGGEEFTVVFPRTDLQAAVAIAKQMRAQVGATPFPILEGRTVTASFGVSHTDIGGTFSDAYGRADAALYRAKHSGRNTVAVDAMAGETISGSR